MCSRNYPAGDDSVEAMKEAEQNVVAPADEGPYWVFVCNPKKWAIDRFFDRQIEHDSWGVRPSDRGRFAPGQLGIVRVGVDRRSVAELRGKAPKISPMFHKSALHC